MFEAINSNLDANLNCFQPLNKELKEEDEKLEWKKNIEFTINGIKSKTSLFPISFSQHYLSVPQPYILHSIWQFQLCTADKDWKKWRELSEEERKVLSLREKNSKIMQK